MKKISQTQWKRYKEADGAAVIADFVKLAATETTPEEMLAIAKKYDSDYFNNYSAKEDKYFINRLNLANEVTVGLVPEKEEELSEDTLEELYLNAVKELAIFSHGEGATSEDLTESDYKFALEMNMPLSIMLYAFFPTFYTPNFFVMQFKYLQKIAAKYDIDLPEVPKHAKYQERCKYYDDLCTLLNEFANENELEPAELCAFLYGYEIGLIKEEEAEARNKGEELPQPAQAWFIGGDYADGEVGMVYGFWQASPETKRGDLCVFYEKAPIMAVNAIWRAEADGVVDPFFYFYANTYIGHKLTMPSITLDELKADPYFKDHALVRKNFQGVNGWPLTSDDYANLKRIWSDLGADVDKLPALKAHETPKDVVVKNEADVHTKLVLPLLADMGWTEGKGDILNQQEVQLGRGHSKKEGRTDISLHPSKDHVTTKVVIEEKYWMRNEKEAEANFDQGRSYALNLRADTLMTCDKNQIRVYPRQKNGDFRADRYEVFYWDEMKNPDKYNALKKLLN